MAKFLITGGVGFLGTNLCIRLLMDGHQVVAMDNFYTGTENNLEILKKMEGFQLIRHDIVNPLPLERLQDIDGIFNLACPASPPHYQRDPLFTTKVSVYGVFNLLELAKQNNCKIFHTSTSEVYGDPLEHPQKESYRGNVNITGVRACYDEGKRVAESILFDHNRINKLPIKVVRIFNTYGPYMDPDDGRVVSNFILQALRGDNLTLYGDGLQTRSFCYVDDLIEAFIRLYNTDSSTLGPVNIGNPMEFTVKELSELVIKLTGSKSKIVFFDLPKDDPAKRKPDINLAKNLVDWEPKVQLEDGIMKSIEYFKQFI